MSERKFWDIPPRVEIDGRPFSFVRTGVFLGAFFVLVAAIYVLAEGLLRCGTSKTTLSSRI